MYLPEGATDEKRPINSWNPLHRVSDMDVLGRYNQWNYSTSIAVAVLGIIMIAISRRR